MMVIACLYHSLRGFNNFVTLKPNSCSFVVVIYCQLFLNFQMYEMKDLKLSLILMTVLNKFFRDNESAAKVAILKASRFLKFISFPIKL